MTEQNSNGNPDTPATVAEILQKIEGKVVGEEEYIYRGEPIHYDKISSSLYRDYEGEIDTESFDMEKEQEKKLIKAKKHTNEENKTDMQILSELQHYGGKTNLIDFTTDYRIALFFACDGDTSEDGRIILQKKKPLQDKNQIKTPKHPLHRVLAQKGVFVRPPKGYIDAAPEDIVNIPKELKEEILNRLRKYHDISVETIYNDLHGFIKREKAHKSAYTELHMGNTCLFKGDIATIKKRKQAEYKKAVKHYNEAIKLSPSLPPECKKLVIVHNGTHNAAIGLYLRIYNNRGTAHCKKGDYDKAIDDFNKTGEYQTAGDFYKIMGDYYFGIAYGRTNKHDRVDDCYWRAGNGLSHFFRMNKYEPIEKELKQLKVVKNNLKAELKFAKQQKNKPLADIIQKAIIYIQNEFADLPADLNS